MIRTALISVALLVGNSRLAEPQLTGRRRMEAW